MIQLENVTFTYNGSEDKGNLKNISLSIRQGHTSLRRIRLWKDYADTIDKRAYSVVL